MGLNIAPSFRVLANRTDITAKIAERFKSMRVTDETGDLSDTLELELADHDPADPIPVPPVGAELEAFIGYDGEVLRMGLFICDEIEIAGYPGSMTIRARSAPFETTTGGKTDLQSQKTRTWKKGTTVGQMVKRMAGEHGLQPAVSPALSGIALPLMVQSQESDINLLLRLAKQYDAIAKPSGGRLMFVKRGDSSTVSGAKLEPMTFTPVAGSHYRVTIAAREDAGTTVAYYRDTRAAKRAEVAIGDGEPVLRMRMAYPDRASAEAAAKAKHRERARQGRKLTYTMPGNPDVIAEGIASMRGFREGVDGDWLVQRVEHYIGPDGYRTTMECEQPNSADDVRKAVAAVVKDTEQVGVEI